MPTVAPRRSPDRAERIAFLTDCFPVLSETFVGNEIRAVERHGRAVETLAFRRPDAAFQPADAALAERTVYVDRAARPILTPVPSRWMAAWRFAQEQTGLPAASLMLNGARVARVLQRRGVDHIHAHFAWGSAAHAIVAARLAGITVSFVGHGSDVFATPTDLAVKLRHADLAVATCEDTRTHFRDLEPTARVETVACGIDPDRFAGDPAFNGPRTALVFVGRLIERKGVLEILQALRLLPSADRPSLDIVGDGPERVRLEAYAMEHGLDGVRFLGSQPADWLGQHLPRYRALLAPYFEGQDGGRDTGPLVAKEALACGVPVIASAFMGLKEIVDPDCGLLVPPRAVPALAAAIAEASSWSDVELAARGSAGRRRVLDLFTDARQAETLCAAFDALRGEV